MAVAYLPIPAGVAKSTAEKNGARAVSFQKCRGGTYMVISAIVNGHRETREVPVVQGAVAGGQFKHALRTLNLAGGA